MKTRIIAKLDVKTPYITKPVYFESLRKKGFSVDLAKKYYLQGTGEFMYIFSVMQKKLMGIGR